MRREKLPNGPPWDPRPRLMEIEPMMIAGAPWWPLQAVCHAFRVSTQDASRTILPGHKRKVRLRLSKYDLRTYGYISAEGIEDLCRRWSRIPRHEIMAALQRL